MDSTHWYAFLTSCLDILRNGDSKFDGIMAINEFLSLITLKMIEHRIRKKKEDDTNFNDEKIRIGLDCKMTWLYENYCQPEHLNDAKKANELFDLLYNVNRVWTIKQKLDFNLKVVSEEKTRNDKDDCIFVRFNLYTDKLTNITTNITDSKNLTSFNSMHALDVQKLVEKIHKTMGNIDLTKLNYDAFGEAYEKMMADELGNSSKRYGQYFTRRDLIDFIIEELNVKSTDLCYDPACGTGGFLLGFAKAMKKNKEFIKSKLYGQEFLDDVHKTMCFNMLAFGIDGCLQNISKGNSIDMNYHTKVAGKFDVIGANPPFGMSIDCMIDDYQVKVKNSVALFLQHIYFSLKKGGRAGIVIDRGILNNGNDKQNSWEKKLRKFLLENTSINKIINLPTGIFKHTNFATSVIFFTKGETTKSIKYIEGYFKDEDKGKGDKPLYLREEKILNIEDIKNKNYSLKWNDFFGVEKKQECKGWIKLGDVCEILNKSKHKAGDAIDAGKYNFYTSSNIIKKSNFNDYKCECIIIGSGGNGSLFIDKNFSCSADNFILDTKKNIKFIYYFLKLNFKELYKLYKGNGLKHLSQTDLKNFLIPNLPIQHQEEIVKLLDDIFSENKYNINDTIEYLKDYPIFNLLIQKKYDQFEKIINLQENLRTLFKEKKFVKEKKSLQIQGVFNVMCVESNAVEMKLGEICEIKSGKRLPNGHTFLIDKTNHPYIKVGDIDDINNKKYKLSYINEETFKHIKNYIVRTDDLIMSSIGSVGKLLIIPNELDGANLTENCVKLIPNDKLNKKYLLLFLKSVKDELIKIGNLGNCQPKLGIYQIQDLLIPVPLLKVQEEIIKKIEQLESETSHYSTYAKVLQTELDSISKTIENLCKMKNNDGINDDEINDDGINDDTENQTDLESVKSSKSSKSEKKLDNLKKNIKNIKDNTDFESESELETEHDSEESQLNKLCISKSDLVKIDANTKDCCVHWYHPTNKNVYSYNMKEHVWKKDKKKLKEFFEDEIKQIEKNLKKSSKSNKKLETELDENTIENKIKKNKSTSL